MSLTPEFPVGDETETLRAALDELRGFINAGYRRRSEDAKRAILAEAEQALARVAELEAREAAAHEELSVALALSEPDGSHDDQVLDRIAAALRLLESADCGEAVP